jgi:adenosylmethionine-8-amino-7-oxononanoate aminotransferase
MTAVFTRNMTADYPCALRAEGMYIFDTSGKAYLDMSGGAAVSCLGHQNPSVLSAVKKQFGQMAFAHTSFFTNEPQERLAQLLCDRFLEPNARAYFTSGGSEANEAALKMVWQYWRALGKPGKTQVISRQHSYHGNTLGTLSASGNMARRKTMGRVLTEWPRIEACYPYQYKPETMTDAEYGLQAAGALEKAILASGPDNVAAFIAEPIVGASLGAVAAPKNYFRKIREICDQYDVLLILDEIMCGTGRAGTFFAHEQEGVLPDIVTLAKGLGGGYQPLAATVVREKLVDGLQSNGGFDHGHTYIGHATACAAGAAVVETIAQENLLESVVQKGELLQKALEEAFAQHPHIGDIRGRGLFRAIEFVEDRGSKLPLENAGTIAKQLKASAMRHGLICYPGAGSAESGLSTHLLLAPPFILEDCHIDELVVKLTAVIDEVISNG